MQFWNRPSALALTTAVLTAILLTAGCGGGPKSSVKRYDVSGAVTFNGSPVPDGMVIFEPDVKAGNRGPAGHAPIVNGRYDTRKNGLGTVGGAHVIRISGMSGPSDQPGVKPLFNEYKVEKVLDTAASTVDVDVPASAAEGLVIGDPA
jgi:hypothetical protein